MSEYTQNSLRRKEIIDILDLFLKEQKTENQTKS